MAGVAQLSDSGEKKSRLRGRRTKNTAGVSLHGVHWQAPD